MNLRLLWLLWALISTSSLTPLNALSDELRSHFSHVSVSTIFFVLWIYLFLALFTHSLTLFNSLSVSKDYKKQEASWNKAGHKEPYEGQNLEAHDEKISELEDTQAKLEEERTKEAMVKNIVTSSTKASIEEKRMAMETMFAQDLKEARDEREWEEGNTQHSRPSSQYCICCTVFYFNLFFDFSSFLPTSTYLNFSMCITQVYTH